MFNTKYIIVFLLSVVMKNCQYEAYSTFQTYIPHGAQVPNPCDRSGIWSGVGHRSPAGGDERNPFGLDFKASGFNWTAVCNLDSDGDGRSNGMELGDPTCVWKRGDPSPSGSDITHPGVCEPLDDDNCTVPNSWLTCPKPFDCPAIRQPGVMNMSLNLLPTPVPTEVTSYVCYGFVFPNDTDYHVIATTPIITNPVVDHHFVLFVCMDPPGVDYFTKPIACGMAPVGCVSMITVWSSGLVGECLSDAYGLHIGPGGYRYAVLQVHMNNPTMVSNLMDSSGFLLYYTATMRPNDGTIMVVGQETIRIPPRQPSTSYSGKCSSGCTSAALSQPVYMTGAFIHMHLLGASGDFSLRSNGVTTILANQSHYDYNAPIYFNFDPPHTLHPGDELHVNCNYDSSNTNTTTYFGEATNDEMCYVFIAYYPLVETFTYCTQGGNIDQCLGGALINCNTSHFYTYAPYVSQYNCTETECPPSCQAAMQEIVATGCLDGELGEYFTDERGFPHLPHIREVCSRSEGNPSPTNPSPTNPPSANSPSTAANVFSDFQAVAAAVVMSGIYVNLVVGRR